MGHPRNIAVEVRHFGDADGLGVVSAPAPDARQGVVRIRVFASGAEYADVANLMRAQHPSWFKDDLGRLFDILAAGAIRPRVAERIPWKGGSPPIKVEAPSIGADR